MTDIPSLVRLYLEDNEIEDIDESAFANLHKLVELKLSSNKLTDFPKITNSAKLRRLYLSRNRLVRLHANTLADVNLEQLTVSSSFNPGVGNRESTVGRIDCIIQGAHKVLIQFVWQIDKYMTNCIRTLWTPRVFCGPHLLFKFCFKNTLFSSQI